MHFRNDSLLAMLASQLHALAFSFPTSQNFISTIPSAGLCSTIRKPGSSIYIKISCHKLGNPLDPDHISVVLDEAAASVANLTPLSNSNFNSQITDSIWSAGDASLGGQSVVGLRIGAGGTNTDGSPRNSITNGQMGEVVEALQLMYESPPYQPSLFSIGDDELGPLSCGSLLSGPTYPNENLGCWDENDTYCESALCAAWFQA